MNKLIIFLTLTIFFTTLNAQKVKESFHPKEDFELRTDTTFNSTNIYWIFRSIPENYIIQEYQEGNKLYKYNYRNTEIEVSLPTGNLLFNKLSFKDSIEHDYSKDFILNNCDFEGFNSQTSELQFFLTITKPETDWTYVINLFIRMDGTSRFELPTFEDDY